ncbi:MAG: VTT domain-containing protein [Gemmatimonadaceae bacterium]|nr:VTT domain-containing protein [Gemmatimonadaceae bacterium]
MGGFVAWIDWLAALPAPLLYAAIAIAAFAENIFPPLPADTVVALGAFVAARGNGTATGAWVATMVGNLAGAMSMFYVGRRIGVQRLSARFPRVFPPLATADIAERFKVRGLPAVAMSRFVPGVRAVVPPVAGAIGMRAVPTAVAMSLASGVWYGIVCWMAFNAGANAERLLEQIAAQQRVFALVAVALVGGVVAYALWRRRRP